MPSVANKVALLEVRTKLEKKKKMIGRKIHRYLAIQKEKNEKAGGNKGRKGKEGGRGERQRN